VKRSLRLVALNAFFRSNVKSSDTWQIAPLALAVVLLAQGCDRTSQSAQFDPAQKPPPPTAPSSNAVPVAATPMILVKGGTFAMGDKDEVDATLHEVVVRSFLIDRDLVTQEAYEKLMGENPSRWKGKENPVEQVRWSDAVRYCNKRSEKEGLQPCYDLGTWKCNFDANGYRLPTEAEWEYACRAGTTTAYFFGDNPAKLGDHAWFDKNSGGHPHPVGQKLPNPWGLRDMCGNLWQWCNDFYQVDYYKNAPRVDPRGPAEGPNKVVRGGAWRFSASNCRPGYRYNESPGYADVCFGYDIYGFRCARNDPAASPSAN
jgi:formylglycine-generating enzyme required for sulfatase activity